MSYILFVPFLLFKANDIAFHTFGNLINCTFIKTGIKVELLGIDKVCRDTNIPSFRMHAYIMHSLQVSPLFGQP